MYVHTHTRTKSGVYSCVLCIVPFRTFYLVASTPAPLIMFNSGARAVRSHTVNYKRSFRGMRRVAAGCFGLTSSVGSGSASLALADDV